MIEWEFRKGNREWGWEYKLNRKKKIFVVFRGNKKIMSDERVIFIF